MLEFKQKALRTVGTKFDKHELFRNKNWRINYPLTSFDWYDSLILEPGRLYSVADERAKFDEKGFVFLLCLLTNPDFNKAKLNELHILRNIFPDKEQFKYLPIEYILTIDDLADK
jgi:hypothetical protein